MDLLRARWGGRCLGGPCRGGRCWGRPPRIAWRGGEAGESAQGLDCRGAGEDPVAWAGHIPTTAVETE